MINLGLVQNWTCPAEGDFDGLVNLVEHSARPVEIPALGYCDGLMKLLAFRVVRMMSFYQLPHVLRSRFSRS